jgi:23S rRNA (uracil1939-C5)-methyltransferase
VAHARGAIWTGAQTHERGLVDTLGSLPEALFEARRAAEIDADADVAVGAYPQPQSWLEQWLASSAASNVDADLARLRYLVRALPGVAPLDGALLTALSPPHTPSAAHPADAESDRACDALRASARPRGAAWRRVRPRRDPRDRERHVPRDSGKVPRVTAHPATPHTPRDSVHCVHAHLCSGCPLIERGYASQLETKGERVRRALLRYAELHEVLVAPVAGAHPIERYRVRAKLCCGPEGIGLFAKGGGHRLVDLPECRVLTPDLHVAVSEFRSWLASAAESDLARALRAIDVREVSERGDGSDARVLATLILDRDANVADALIAEVASNLERAIPSLRGVAVSRQAGPQVLGRDLRAVSGAASCPDRVSAHGPFTLASHGAFTQVHRGQAARMHDVVRERLGAAATGAVLDLFSGSGALGLTLAASGARVLLVDTWRGGLDAALDAARAQGIRNVDARAGDAGAVARELATSGARFDAVLANPPRSGLSPAVRDALAALGPACIVYVSCQPETLARDLAHLRWLGYAADSASPLDMIPLSAEVECVVALRRRAAPEPHVLYRDDHVIIADKRPHEPTTPHGEHKACLLERVRAIPGAEAAVPIHRLDAGTSGICAFALAPEHVAGFARALAADSTSKTYLAGVRGIPRAKGTIARALPERGKLRTAQTRYRRAEVIGGHALLHVMPREGRTHQIRRHLAEIGHALLGDTRYGHTPTNRHLYERHGLDRTFLHYTALELVHPATGRPLRIESPLCGDLVAVVASLGGVAPSDA